MISRNLLHLIKKNILVNRLKIGAEFWLDSEEPKSLKIIFARTNLTGEIPWQRDHIDSA